MSAPEPDTAESPGDEDPQANPQPAPERSDPVPPVPVRRAGMSGALLWLGAAVLTMIGTFQDLVSARNAYGIEGESFAITSWTARIEPGGEPIPDWVPLNGVPLGCAVALELAAAVLALFAATRPSRRWLGRMRGLVAVAAAAFLAATVTTIGMQVLWWERIFQPEVDPDSGAANVTVTVGPGLWTLVVAVALAVVAAVLAWRPSQPEPSQPEPARSEPDTPAFGTPVTVRRLPDAPPDKPDE